MKQTTIVLQAYGATVNLNQNIFCFLTLLHQWRQVRESVPAEVEVVIYTDQPAVFKKFFGPLPRLRYEDLGPNRIKAWRGSIDFVHRVKVEMLKNAAQKHPQSQIFYVDGDTLFLRDPTELFSEINGAHSWMHELENVIEQGSDPISKKLTRFLRRREFQVGSEKIRVPTDLAMWNAGVLGFAPEFAPQLINVLTLTEQLYSSYPKHVMEQLAFSYYLQKFTQVRESRHVILHYWRQKELYNERIAGFLAENESLAGALKSYETFVRPPAPAPLKTKRPISRKIGDLVGRFFAN